MACFSVIGRSWLLDRRFGPQLGLGLGFPLKSLKTVSPKTSHYLEVYLCGANAQHVHPVPKEVASTSCSKVGMMGLEVGHVASDFQAEPKSPSMFPSIDSPSEKPHPSKPIHFSFFHPLFLSVSFIHNSGISFSLSLRPPVFLTCFLKDVLSVWKG